MKDRRPKQLQIKGKWRREYRSGGVRGPRVKTAQELIEMTEQYVEKRLELEEWR